MNLQKLSGIDLFPVAGLGYTLFPAMHPPGVANEYHDGPAEKAKCGIEP
jgi:hypothetical protein